ESGTVSSEKAQIGYLQQNTKFSGNGTIMEEMRLVFRDLLEIKDELSLLQHRMGELEHDSMEYKELEEEYTKKNNYFEQHDGYILDVKIHTILNGMGFMDYNKDTPVEVLSGGEKTRLALARLLLTEPDLLILDEPTNHLDFKTLGWLEDYLTGYKGAILVVSHDRYFLDRLVGQMWELENKKLSLFKGNYSAYVVQKKERVERQLKEYHQQQEEILSMQDYVRRNIARASTSKSAKSRIAALDRMEIIDKPYTDNRSAGFKFEAEREPVKD
ncbi:MAG: ATP-binding cassette domain-containing protein, partial [Oscillospiraceae bacterium]